MIIILWLLGEIGLSKGAGALLSRRFAGGVAVAGYTYVMIYYVMLCYIMLYYIVLCHSMLGCYIILYYIIVYFTVL